MMHMGMESDPGRPDAQPGAAMRRGYADTRFGQVHYQQAGQGPVLVLLPAATQAAFIFDGLMQRLSARYRVVALDTLGSSFSGPLPEGATFETLAMSVLDSLDSLSIDRAHIYGIHTGNKIAAAFASRWPDRVGDTIICGQSHSIVPDMKTRTAQMRRVTQHNFAGEAAAIIAGLKLWADAHKEITSLWWRPDVFGENAASAMAEIRTQIVHRLLSFESMAALYEANFAYDLESDLRRLPNRTLIVEIATPLEDQEVGRQGNALLGIVPRSSLITFEESDGLGLTLAARADELAMAIDAFLSGDAERQRAAGIRMPANERAA
jgi:pimeloyl-ACP methyl ester carboxylesterase